MLAIFMVDSSLPKRCSASRVWQARGFALAQYQVSLSGNLTRIPFRSPWNHGVRCSEARKKSGRDCSQPYLSYGARCTDPNTMAHHMTLKDREIYIIEDDLSVRESLSFLLSSVGYTVVCFADGEALKAVARTRCPACILLDVNLPGRSGLDILKELRDTHYPAPIVMMTGSGSIDVAVRSLKLGAVDFIEKPFVGSDLILRLEQAMATRSEQPKEREIVARLAVNRRQPLSVRERQVFQEILRGRSDKEIGDELRISSRTAEVHRASILCKLGARSTTDLLRIAFT
jgi:FixJ family two-component response regulator